MPPLRIYLSKILGGTVNKIDGKTETIFAHAVALDSSGRLKNTIYAIVNVIYILNSDHTVLLRFDLPKSSAPFKSPISFKANDYDSNTFYEEDGKIVFLKKAGDMERRKFSGKGNLEPEEIETLFAGMNMASKNVSILHKDILSLLDESLSHIEFSGKGDQLKIIQRNIFDGTIIEITRTKSTGFGAVKKDSILSDFGPFGMRTGDFIALFSFNDEIEFVFPSGQEQYLFVFGKKVPMKGIVALCFYDEMGEITYSTGDIERAEKVWVYHEDSDEYAIIEESQLHSEPVDLLGPAIHGDFPELEKLIQEVYGHGRKEQKERRSEQSADRPSQKRQCRSKR